jgi:hypothetical protein
MSKKLLFLISFVLVLSLAGNALEADTEWDRDNGAGVDRRWDTGENWDIPGGSSSDFKVPEASDDVYIEDQYTDDGNGPIIDGNTTAVCNWLSIGWAALPAADDAVLRMTGGTLTTGNAFLLNNGLAGTARFDMSGGAITTATDFYLGYDVGAGYSIVNMDGGTMDLDDGADIEVGVWGDATFNMTAGDINCTGWLDIGGYETAGSTPGDGHVDLQGGTIETTFLAMGGGGVGTMNLAGGTLIIDGDYRGPNGFLFDPENDTPSDTWYVYTGTIAILAQRGLITAYDTNVGEIIADTNYPSQVGLRAVINLDYDVTNPDQTTITAAAVDPNLAWDPDPLNGSGGLLPPDINRISWAAGDNAASHEVYFGTSFAEVDSATTSSAAHKATKSLADVNYPVSVTWGITYYWRIDEVNGATTWKGTVWNFGTAPAWAANPTPEDGAEGVSPTSTVLSWDPGAEVDTHELYFGTDFNDVNDRLGTPLTPGANSYDPGALDFNTTYYWAVDEVNLAAVITVWPGEVWEFTTDLHATVDDFNSYANQTALWNVWDDYWTNGTGSEVFIEADVDFVRDNNSLRYKYDNDNKKNIGSIIDADTVDLEVGSDWTVGGAKALLLYFAGEPGNSATAQDRMWIELEDINSIAGVARYDGDPNDVKDESWNEWNIDLALFDACGVSLANVDKVHIGFGGPQGGQGKVAGGTGTVWFDEIELWPSYCRPELAIADFTDDCVTDNWDLQIMARDWLVYDYNFIAAEPCDANLIGFWKFDEGLDSTTVDSSGYGNDGNVIDASWTTGYPNDPCDSALDFAGDGVATFDRVICAERVNDVPGIYPAELMPDKFTISCWTRLDRFDYFGAFVSNGIDYSSDECGFFLYNDGYDGEENFGLGIRTESANYYVETASIYKTKTWYHLAATYDGNYASVYVDGQVAAGPTDVGGPLRWISNASGNYPEYFAIGMWLDVGYSLYVNGAIDEVRYYDYALSQGDISVLAGLLTAGTEAYQPVPSVANITDPEPILSRKVNFADHGLMADNWLQETLWP